MYESSYVSTNMLHSFCNRKHTIRSLPLPPPSPVTSQNNNHDFSKLIIILLCVTLQPKLDGSVYARATYRYPICVECFCVHVRSVVYGRCVMSCRVVYESVNSLHFIPLFRPNGAPGSTVHTYLHICSERKTALLGILLAAATTMTARCHCIIR